MTLEKCKKKEEYLKIIITLKEKFNKLVRSKNESCDIDNISTNRDKYESEEMEKSLNYNKFSNLDEIIVCKNTM